VREVNNSSVTSDNEDDDEGKNVNGVSPRDSRSVSSTLHDRSRISGNLSSTSTAGGRAPKEQQQHRSHHRTGSHSNHSNTNPGQAGAGAAKETFLNYFFGTQGPASGPSAAIPSGIRSQNTHTDILGDEPLPEQDMGKVAAFDMKSLGKHIETVSNNRCTEGASI
jgi:dynamin 1-like protein